MGVKQIETIIQNINEISRQRTHGCLNKYDSRVDVCAHCEVDLVCGEILEKIHR